MEVKNIFENEPNSKITEKLLEIGFTKKFEDGEVILDEQSFIKAIPIVLSGNVRVMRTDDDDREILLYYIQPGESCIMSFLGGMHQDTSKIKAIAEDETELLFIPVDSLGHLMKNFPEWLDYIFKLYHKRFEELLEVVNAIAFKKLDTRLFDLLKLKSELVHSKLIHVTHEQLAKELGTVRVVVSRLLKQMEEVGMIELGRNKITLM